MTVRRVHGPLRLALDRDLLKLKKREATKGRDALVRMVRDLADAYDLAHGHRPPVAQNPPSDEDEKSDSPEPDYVAPGLEHLLGMLDRLGVGRVPLVEQVDKFSVFQQELEGID